MSARVEAASSTRRELVQALQYWAEAVRQVPGLVEVRLSEDIETAGAYQLTSSWTTSECLDTHLASAAFGVLLGACQVLSQRTRFELAWSEVQGADADALIRRTRTARTADVTR